MEWHISFLWKVDLPTVNSSVQKETPHCRRLVYDCQAKQMLATLGLDSVPEACMYGLGGFFWVKTRFILVLDGKIYGAILASRSHRPSITFLVLYLEPQEIEKQIELEGVEGEGSTQAWYSGRRLG